MTLTLNVKSDRLEFKDLNQITVAGRSSFLNVLRHAECLLRGTTSFLDVEPHPWT